jgi:hypothetical protein
MSLWQRIQMIEEANTSFAIKSVKEPLDYFYIAKLNFCLWFNLEKADAEPNDLEWQMGCINIQHFGHYDGGGVTYWDEICVGRGVLCNWFFCLQSESSSF